MYTMHTFTVAVLGRARGPAPPPPVLVHASQFSWLLITLYDAQSTFMFDE